MTAPNHPITMLRSNLDHLSDYQLLLATICHRLWELGHQRAYLTTSTIRVAAIHLYEKFGFEAKEQAQGY